MVDIHDSKAPKATPPKKPKRATAVALEHEKGTVPKITAAGYGKIAEQIVEIAFQNGVKVREDADLAQMLAAIELESEIPSEALVAVAEILAYVYKANGTYQPELTPESKKDASDD